MNLNCQILLLLVKLNVALLKNGVLSPHLFKFEGQISIYSKRLFSKLFELLYLLLQFHVFRFEL